MQHYIPTLLALKGVEGETDCSGSMTYVHWWGEGDSMKPETFVRSEVSGDLIEQMRCAPPASSPDTAIKTALQDFLPMIVTLSCLQQVPCRQRLLEDWWPEVFQVPIQDKIVSWDALAWWTWLYSIACMWTCPCI